jgi:saccharopine dehydrogenase-like NADP-dependent oxidoreductase
MQVVVFGGAGVVGSYAVQCLTKMDLFSHIIIADSDETRAKNIAKTSEKIDFIQINATDDKSLLKSLEHADVAINCVGPFYKFAPRILKAVITKGINYVDVCDDYDITEKLLDDYHKMAQNAGSTCIIGLGASPGLTNMIVAFGAKQLTAVHDVKVFVARGIEEEAGSAIPYHMMHCWLGKIPIYKNGRFERAQGLVDGEEYATFPDPYGQVPVYYFGHPETVTIPRYIKGVQNVCCKGTFFPKEFREALIHLETLGLLSDTPITVQGNSITPLDFTAAYIDVVRKKTIERVKRIPSGGTVMVQVIGDVDGESKTFRYAGISHMREGTGTPVAIGAKMLAEGEIKSPGVFAPEGCIPPEDFVMNFLALEGFGDVWLTTTQKMSGSLN